MAGILHMMNAPIGGSSGLALLIDTANVNVANMLLANGWDGVSIIHPILTIGSGARIYSLSTGIPALTSGALPIGSTLTIISLLDSLKASVDGLKIPPLLFSNWPSDNILILFISIQSLL